MSDKTCVHLNFLFSIPDTYSVFIIIIIIHPFFMPLFIHTHFISFFFFPFYTATLDTATCKALTATLWRFKDSPEYSPASRLGKASIRVFIQSFFQPACTLRIAMRQALCQGLINLRLRFYGHNGERNKHSHYNNICRRSAGRESNQGFGSKGATSCGESRVASWKRWHLSWIVEWKVTGGVQTQGDREKGGREFQLHWTVS